MGLWEGAFEHLNLLSEYFIGDIQLSLQQLDEQDPAVVIFRYVR